MSTSIGALQRDKRFLARKSRADKVTSANRPRKKVTVERLNPMTVRYWKCQPYASLLVRYYQHVWFLTGGYTLIRHLRPIRILVHTAKKKSAIRLSIDNMDMIYIQFERPEETSEARQLGNKRESQPWNIRPRHRSTAHTWTTAERPREGLGRRWRGWCR